MRIRTQGKSEERLVDTNYCNIIIEIRAFGYNGYGTMRHENYFDSVYNKVFQVF